MVNVNVKFNIENRAFVIPGQKLGSGIIKYDLNCFRENNSIFSSVIGLAKIEEGKVKVIPSSGIYIPKEDDVVIGVVIRKHINYLDLDINSPYECILINEEKANNVKSSNKSNENFNILNKFEVGDVLSVKILSVNEVNFSQAVKPWKLETGLILEVNPKRVPRIIGKKKSMLNLIKEKTKCRVIVGQNGRIWIKGEKANFVERVIKKIVKEAQTQGLTDRIEKLLNTTS